MSLRIVALVPMRHQSERVPGKNYRPLGGRPLYHHVVSALIESGVVDEVVIDTDSDLISRDAREAFPDVRLLERPPHLRGGEIPMNDIIRHDMSVVAADVFVQTHSTNPLLRATTIAAAVSAFVSDADGHDSLFSVTALRTRLWWPDGRPVNHDPAVLLRTQDLPPLMEENSCLYVFSRSSFERNGRRIGERPLLFPIEAEEAWDIDEELDFRVADFLYGQRVGA